jgi:SAM-dependent methyltransferase
MIKRIKKIIQREKLKNPKSLGVVLLFSRIMQVCTVELNELWMYYKKDSTFKSKDNLWMSSLFPEEILSLIIEKVKPKTVLDVGCGIGNALDYFINQGVDAVGIENSKIAISHARNPEKIIRHNLNREISLQRTFDLVWCFEVIEHIHPTYEKTFLQTLTRHSRLIILSAARPGQGGHGHFNEQLPEYWIKKFEHLNFEFDEKFSNELRQTNDTHTENILVFKQN